MERVICLKGSAKSVFRYLQLLAQNAGEKTLKDLVK